MVVHFKSIIAAAAVALIATFVHVSIASAADEQIEGAWNVRMDVPALSQSFNAFMTFSAGGGVIENAWAVGQLSSTGTGHGAWKKAGAQDVAVNVLFIWLNAGVVQITGRAHGLIHLDRGSNAIAGNIVFESFDSSGHVLFSNTGTLQGTRITTD